MAHNIEYITKKERDVLNMEEYIPIEQLIQWLQLQKEKGATHITATQDYVGNTLTSSIKFKD